MGRTALIIGAGPAGLTAAFELLERTGILPLVLERSEYIGGISRTVNYKGNRLDIGGHRFFSKSDRVMDWWLRLFPLENAAGEATRIHYHRQSRELPLQGGSNPSRGDRVMLVRPRKSRIYFQRKFFDYPLSPTLSTFRNLGLIQSFLILVSYLRSLAFPVRPEVNLEHFFINRFGRRLYHLFFRSYTEKVWGVPCPQISAEWGAQRIKGLSLWRSMQHFVSSLLLRNRDLAQRKTETSLIERFLYPKYGPGQLWEEVASLVRQNGGQILTHWEVRRILHDGARVLAVEAFNLQSGETRRFEADFFFSTMPVKDLIEAFDPPAPEQVRTVAEGLVYRDFITVGLLCRRLLLADANSQGNLRIKDNWIYVQEPDVRVGRIQIFNNWSPYLVKDPDTVWIGLEYFCNQGDELWRLSDEALIALAKEETCRLNVLDPADLLDATVIRMEKTYPAYFGSYPDFGAIRSYTDSFPNLFLIGRNGMHKYNNQDHSMLTAMIAVDNILAGVHSKDNLWAVNTENSFHEEKENA